MIEKSRKYFKDNNKSKKLSVVIPIHNEEENIAPLYKRIVSVADEISYQFQIIFVNDGSVDRSSKALNHIATVNNQVKVVHFSRNFGKEAAVSAGMKFSDGDAVVIIDADLQDPPELIPQMIQCWEEGFDVVCMKRKTRKGEGLFKKLSAYFYYRLLRIVAKHDIPKDVGDFRLMSREVIDALNELSERNRYMKGLFSWVGFDTKIIEYDREERFAGKTKWNYLKLFGLAIEGITSFSISPIRLMTAVGFLTSLSGAIFGLWVFFTTVVMGNEVDGYPSLIVIITLIGGIQLLSLGLLGEYVGKIYIETKQRPLYIVRNVVSNCEETSTNLAITMELPHANSQ